MNFDIVGTVQTALGVPVGFDTDVNGAALGEYRWGAAQGQDPFVYLTVGTGIGGGGIINGKPMHGLLHPEMGHILIPYDRNVDAFAGCCPNHGTCLEGLASGPAIRARWGQDPVALPPDHPAWQLEADYLARGLVNVICTLSPRKVVLGGGVMEQRHLFPLLHQKVSALLNGYLPSPDLTEHIETYMLPPKLTPRSGVLGAIALAQQAAATARTAHER